MTECEVCGKSVSRSKKADIDGVVLDVCEKCVKLGREMPKPLEGKKVVLKRRVIETPEFERELVRDFSGKVREEREKRNLSQEDAARKIGISPSLLRRIENGFRPDEATAMKIQRFYSISLYEEV